MAAPKDSLLTVRETARRLGVHENTIRNWVTSGYLRSARLPGSRFHRFEAAEVDRVANARGLPVVEALQKTRRVPELADAEQVIRPARKGRMPAITTASAPKPELVGASDLSVWAGRRDTQGLFPKLIRRLLVATAEVNELSIIRADEGIAAQGWDGLVSAQRGSLWVPSGRSAWELGTNADIRAKAQSDYEKRTADPLGLDPAQTTFVFATPRRWSGAEKWARERQSEGVWRAVHVVDADRLEAWLEAVSPVHYWLSEELGLRPRHAVTIERWWDQFASRTKPPSVPQGLLLAGRDRQVEELERFLESPPLAMGIQAGSRTEAIAFVAATVQAAQDKVQQGVVVVRNDEVWERLCTSTTPMVLVADFDDPAVGAALAGGHHVVTPLGREDIARGATIELPRIHRLVAQEALQEAGFSFEDSDRFAGLARRSLVSFIRGRALDPRMARPRWGEGEAAATLAPLMLVGAWSSSDADRQAVEEIVGLKWQVIEGSVRHWSVTDDPPFTRSGNGWHLTSPEEAFDVLHESLSQSVVDRWRIVTLRVLAEVDPATDLSQEQRFLPGNADHPAYSEALRRGLAKSMTVLGALGTDAGPDAMHSFASHVDLIARELFAKANADESGLLWRSLSDELPLLAEAAPQAFLDALDVGMSGTALIATMFRDSPDQAFFFASSPHTGLLWALETLCWSPALLPDALMALARLAAIDPGGKLGNRPAGSLRSVLLPWVPYTAASVDERLNAFRQVRKKYPEIAWRLLLGLLPKHHDHSSPTSSPRFRDWKPDREGVTVAEWARSVEGLVDEASEMVRDEPARWLELVANLAGLPVHLRLRLIDELAGALLGPVLDEEQRLELWEGISQEVDHHREFPSAQWVMDGESLEKLEAVASSLAPKDRIVQDAKLFDWRPRLPGGARRSDGHDYDRALEEAQGSAVATVYAEGGLDGVRRLAAQSPQAHFVGHSLAKAVRNEPTDELLAMLGLAGKHGDLAQGWLRQAVDLRGTAWARSLKERVIALDPEAQAAFLRQLPSGPDLKQLLDEFADNATAAYWRSIHPLIFGHDETAFAVRQLMDHGRPAAAVELLTVRLHSDKKPPDGVTAELVGDAPHARHVQRCVYLHEPRETNLSDHSALLVELEWTEALEQRDVHESLTSDPAALF